MQTQVGARTVVPRPRLYDLLDSGAQRALTLVSAPAGSGKTMLVRSWLRGRAVVPGPVAWASIERHDWDAADFWREIAKALRAAGVATGRAVHDDLDALPEGLTLVIDDVHHLASGDASAALGRLLAGAPRGCRVILLTRKDPSLGLHRLRLTADLTEIRAVDLRFTQGEADALLRDAGVTLSGAAVAQLHERTEGWAAGLRLAAMFLANSKDPESAVAEFSGTERTVAEYLIGEVLAHQPPEVRDLLLRTCILEHVDGQLANALTGREDGERLLLELEDANAFVTAVDAERSWFRYHQLLVDLLRVELRRQLPSAARELHRRAARWLAEHGLLVDAMRQAARGEDYATATTLLSDHWPALLLDGEDETLSALLRELPPKLRHSDPELAVTFAADRLRCGQWDEAGAHLAQAAALAGGVRVRRRGRFAVRLAVARLYRAARLGPAPGDLERAEAALRPGEPDLRALGLLSLGAAELWAGRFDDADRHLREALALAERLDRPHIAIGGLGHWALVAARRGELREAERRALEAVALAQRLGRLAHPSLAAAYAALASVCTESLAGDDAETWIGRAELVLHDAPQPALEVTLAAVRGQLALARRRDAEAAEQLAAARRLCARLCEAHHLAGPLAAWHARALLHLGDRAAVQSLAADSPESRLVHARALLGDGDPGAALAALGPPPAAAEVAIEAGLVEAVARDRLGQRDAAVGALERALELAQPDGRKRAVADGRDAVRDLLERHPRHATRHGAFIGELLDDLDGRPPRTNGAELETLSERELRVLRYLPTNLTLREIAGEMIVSTNTVKTHVRGVYAKLHVHGRSEAVDVAREAGLLAPERR